MANKTLLVLAVATLTGAAATAQTLELEGRYWAPTLTGQVQVTGGAQVPNGLGVIDLKDDLGFSDKRFEEWRVSLATGPHSRLRVAYLSMDYRGDQQVQRTIVFNGQTYTVGTRVVSGRWGQGTVQRYDGDRVTVLFDEHGYRELFVPLVLERGLLRLA